jgi:hypothetical protein
MTADSHVACRIDGYPPDAPTERRLYRCRDGCEFLTAPQLAASPIPHEVPDSVHDLLDHYQAIRPLAPKAPGQAA